VDPGSIRTGYGAIETDGRRHRLIEKGVLLPSKRFALHERLHVVHAGIAALIARLHPDALAVEDGSRPRPCPGRRTSGWR
jgi:crossover junction endodeoxyribonuclease RuvC